MQAENMTKISGVCSVVDEEIAVLPLALKSVGAFVDEIVLVDMTSAGYSEMTKTYKKVKVYKHERVSHVELVRNFSIAKASGDWIFIFDPDEEVPQTLAKKLRAISQKSEAEYYRLPRKNIVFGKWMKHSRWWPDYNVRFFKKKAVNWVDAIHAVPETSGSGYNLPAEENLAIVHHNYNSIDQYLGRMNRYTSVQAELKIKSGYRFDWTDLVSKPSAEFFSRYFAGAGFKDGLHGLVLATLQALSEFVVYLKVWEKEGFADINISLPEVLKQGKQMGRNLNYWKADALLSESPNIIQRVKRKFKLS